MLHDARTPGVADLVDDELNGMLARLGSKTKNIVVIFDSCNSGSADRGPSAGTFIARFQPLMKQKRQKESLPAQAKEPLDGCLRPSLEWSSSRQQPMGHLHWSEEDGAYLRTPYWRFWDRWAASL
jgi:hypothetical protein